MKVIFLDVDGVLNDDLAYKAALNNPDKDTFDDSDNPTDEHLKQLKEIVEETGAKIVLSSSWRCSSKGLAILLESLYKYGMTLFSITEEGVPANIFNNLHIKPKNTARKTWDGTNEVIIYDRGAEIMAWLMKNRVKYKITNIVILDDDVDDILPYYIREVVKTDYMTGLTDKNVEDAIRILNHYE